MTKSPTDASLMQRLTGLGLPALVAVVALVADRVSKIAVERYMEARSPVLLLGDWARLVLWHNDGAAFGIYLGGKWIHVSLSLMAMGLVAYMIWHAPRTDRVGLIGFGLIMGGAVGNLWDRLTAGRVTDFLDVGIGAYRWPTFNVADSCIVVGIGLLAVTYFLFTHRAKRDDSQQVPGLDSDAGAAAGPGSDTA